nr:MAG TPA: hypothetical protein [Caudoviricetes sp.]
MANKSFKSYLNEKSYEDLKQLWNEYASDKDGDSYIYDSVEEFAELTGEDIEDFELDAYFAEELKSQLQETIV